MLEIEAEVYDKKNILSFPHLHGEIEFIICMDGEIEVTCGKEKRTIKQNDFVLIMPHTIHMYQTLKYSKSLIVMISKENLPIFHQYFSKEPSNPFVENLRNSDIEYASRMLCSDEKSTLTIEQLIGYVHIILNAAFKKIKFKEKRGVTDLLPNILSYINENFQNSISLNDISRHIGVSSSYLSRFFADKFGCTITKYINETRVNCAKMLLLSSDDPITEIVYKCGFESIRTFNRVFFEFTNSTPREYRNNKNRTANHDSFSTYNFRNLLTTSGLTANDALTFYK